MEAYVPLWRRVMAKVLRIAVFRRGQLIVQGKEGIFKLWRCIGDTREAFLALSKVTYMTKLWTLNPELGKTFMAEEKQLKEEEPPDPLCACCCCPYTPPPTGFQGETLLERYAMRYPREMDIYSRKMAIRPATCLELYCGRGCQLECACCCCCRLDELLTDFVITTHRILVEQRTVQRYCRWFACCRSTPNIRTTYLAHNKASAYLCQKDAMPFGFSKLRQDLGIKLLSQDAREYTAGLMLMQRPYLIFSKKDMPVADKIWVSHITAFYDLMTQKEDYARDEEGDEDESGGGSEHDSEDEDDFDAAPLAPPPLPLPPEPEPPEGKPETEGKGKRGKAGGKGQQKGKKGKVMGKMVGKKGGKMPGKQGQPSGPGGTGKGQALGAGAAAASSGTDETEG
uniref:Uncharacterized protein n=1 Tax=Pyrodinium bahamense TaxID=73915 RepID=A0A7R9ZY48_9DINO